MSFEFGMRRPQGFVTAPAEPEDYDVDEEEADPAPPQAAGEADLGAVLDETNVVEVLDQLDRELIALNPVKTRIREIAALLLIDKLRGDVGLADRSRRDGVGLLLIDVVVLGLCGGRDEALRPPHPELVAHSSAGLPFRAARPLDEAAASTCTSR